MTQKTDTLTILQIIQLLNFKNAFSCGNSHLSSEIMCSRNTRVCPEGSRKLRFPDYVTVEQNGGKVVSLTRRFLPPGNTPGTHSVVGRVAQSV